MRPSRLALTTVFVLLTATISRADTIYFLVTSGQSGAQTQIDVNHTSTWLFSPTADFLFGGGSLTMKDGPDTTANIALAIWEGTPEGGMPLSSMTLTNAPFTQKFDVVQFPFTSVLWLVRGHTYTIALTSDAADQQREAYFIKATKYGFEDANGNPLPTQPMSESPVPEPPSWSLFAGSAGLLLAFFQFRRARPFSC